MECGREKQIVQTASRQLRELSRAEGQNEVGKWRRSSRRSRSSHTKVCILRFLPSGIARNRCGVMFFISAE